MRTLIVKFCRKTISMNLTLLAVILFLSGGCTGEEQESTPLIISEPEIVHTPTHSPTKTPTHLPPVTSTPAASETPLPSATPNPVVSVFGPFIWSTTLKGSIESLNGSGSIFQWEIANDESLADLIISTDSGDYSAGYRPLVLTVPMAADWDQLSIEEANEILLIGHPLVEIQDIRELNPENKVLKIDGSGPYDAGYPLKQSWSVVHKEGFENAAEELSDLIIQQPYYDPIVHLAAVGDIMLDRSLGSVIVAGNIGHPFEFVAEELSSADLTVGNLESSIGSIGEPANKSYTFQAPPEAAKSLAFAGFDLLSLANNHAMDYGQEALLQGISLLQNEGIDVVGAGTNNLEARSPVFLESNGVMLAFLAYVDVPVEGAGFDTSSWSAGSSSPGLNWADSANIALDVRGANEAADIVIVLLHSGYEYVEQPSPEQSSAAKAAIDAGADLVIGHHTHVLQGMEFYNGGVIAYGLGNFAFEIDGDPNTGILNIWLNKEGIQQLDLVPAVIQFGGQPRLAMPWEADGIRQRVNYLTDLLSGE